MSRPALSHFNKDIRHLLRILAKTRAYVTGFQVPSKRITGFYSFHTRGQVVLQTEQFERSMDDRVLGGMVHLTEEIMDAAGDILKNPRPC
jgi:hypothetical protein